MNPYYDDGQVTIYHGSSRDVLEMLPDKSVDLVFTDPPYSEKTHEGARTGGGKLKKARQQAIGGDLAHHVESEVSQLIDFPPFTLDDLEWTFDQFGRIGKRWTISFLDWRHVYHLEQYYSQEAATQRSTALRFVRHGIYVKVGSAPQFTGDRPGTGWESIAFLHHPKGRMRWNGGGRNSVFKGLKRNDGHPTAKPLVLVAELLRLFTKKGDVVVDPFMGGGSIVRACQLLGRRVIACDMDQRWCAQTVDRISQTSIDLDDEDIDEIEEQVAIDRQADDDTQIQCLDLVYDAI